MAVDYDAWLANPDNDHTRCLLVDVKAYTGTAGAGGSEITRYLSTLYARPAGAYLPVIREIPTFEAQIREAWGGRTFASIGDLEIQNDDGVFDDWLNDSWGGREIVLRFGDVSWDKADYEVIRTGTVQRLEVANESTLRLIFRDRQGELDKQVQLNTVDDGENGEVEIPLCYGYCYHVAPVLVDSTTRKYQVHDGACEDVCVQLYVDGLASAISVTKTNASGFFTLASDPNGKVTCDVKGAKPSAWLEKPGEIMREIVTDKGGLTDPGDIDTTAFSSIDTGAPQIGIYVDRPTNILTILDEIAATNRLWYGFNRAGKFTIGRIAAPTSGASTLDLRTSLQQIEGMIVTTPLAPPRYKTRLGYRPVWARLSLDEEELEKRSSKKYRKHKKAKVRAMYIAPTVAEELREWIERGYRVSEYEDANASNIQTQHLDAEAPEVEESLISNETDALAEATARQGLYNTVRYQCELTAYATPYQIEIGDVITVYDDPGYGDGRFGFESGRPILVVGLVETPGEGLISITGWY